eukprot:364441-Chlamydomonas_euryale.AAC.5
MLWATLQQVCAAVLQRGVGTSEVGGSPGVYACTHKGTCSRVEGVPRLVSRCREQTSALHAPTVRCLQSKTLNRSRRGLALDSKGGLKATAKPVYVCAQRLRQANLGPCFHASPYDWECRRFWPERKRKVTIVAPGTAGLLL